MLNIRLSRDRLIFNMGIPILVKLHLYTETVPHTMGYNSLDPSMPTFACHSVRAEGEAARTATVERAHGIDTLVVTSSIVHRALVDVWNKIWHLQICSTTLCYPSIISQHCHRAIVFPRRAQKWVYSMLNVAADGLSMQGARAHEAMVLFKYENLKTLRSVARHS